MKRKVLIAIVGAMSILLVACGSNIDTNKQDSGTVENQTQEKELTEEEKAAIYTIQQLRDNLKNPHSMKIYSIFYKYNTTHNWYLFKIEYSAENNIGGTVEDTLYYQFDTDIYSEDSQKALSARMFGCEEIDWNSYGKNYNGDETELEVDRILDNIDIDILKENQ
jgi:hypothetical protein